MKNQSVIPVFILFCSVAIGLVASTGCANIIPPSGGYKDTLAPILVSSVPRDSTLNFKGNKIVLSFDEYIELQSIQQQLIVSPMAQMNPIIDHKLKTITIKLKDSLEKNTTYSFNFGEAIKDINEGNIMKGFTYIFSTGSYFDSLTLSGKVVIAETGKTDSTLLAILHKNLDDSAIMHFKPRYLTKVNNKGEFTFRNLPSGIFQLYAMKDESGVGKLLGKDQLFAFSDKPIIVNRETEEQLLYAYTENVSPKTKTSGDQEEKVLKPVNNLRLGLLDLLQDFQFSFDTHLRTFDTTKIHFSTDSTFLAIPDYKWIIDSTAAKYTLSASWKESSLYHLILDKDFAEDTLNRKIAKTDTVSFYIRKKLDYGTLKLRFKNLDITGNTMLQFVIGNAVVKSFPLNSENFYHNLFIPGEYELRVLKDENKNGHWDAGDFFKNRLQPEMILPVSQKITIKANWDNEIEIVIPTKETK